MCHQERLGAMGTGAESLPYRATVFLRPMGLHCGQLELMERNFARESDAAVWCRVMTEAEPRATGAWMVAKSKGGRLLKLTREQGMESLTGRPEGRMAVAVARDELAEVLGRAGLPAEPAEVKLLGAA